MEYRIKDYTIKGQRILLPRQTSIEDLRLIFNETQKKLICSTATKDNVTLVQGYGGTLVEVPASVCVLNSTDLLTIKCDYGDNLSSVESNVEEVKQAVENIDLSPIETKVDDGVATLSEVKDALAEVKTMVTPAFTISIKGKNGTQTITIAAVVEQVEDEGGYTIQDGYLVTQGVIENGILTSNREIVDGYLVL